MMEYTRGKITVVQTKEIGERFSKQLPVEGGSDQRSSYKYDLR